MGKNLFIAEKSSVAMEFAKALNINTSGKSAGYVEDDNNIVTWCVGHLIDMLYPEAYDPEMKSWKMEKLPFIPTTYKYGVIEDVKKQYSVVSKLLNRKDVSSIYYSGDSAREGEYIQRLVRQEAGHNKNASEFRVWIDSQTKEEIINGIKNAKPLSAYDNLSDAGYARAIEDYLVGINFSRALSIKYSGLLSNAVNDGKYHAIAVGRVMSCVLGMIVERERLIRNTTVIPFYGISADIGNGASADWKIMPGSLYESSPQNYNNIGLLDRNLTQELTNELNKTGQLTVSDKKTTTSKKAAPLLFNLAELQSECSKKFHINPTETLAIAQSLYEKKLTTYPRTDARVLTNAICKVFTVNIRGLESYKPVSEFAKEVMDNNMYEKLTRSQTKYVDDSQVSDHYAIIPTGQGFENLGVLNELEAKVYEIICKRFLAIFYPDAEFKKIAVLLKQNSESFAASSTVMTNAGYLKVAGKDEDKEENEDGFNYLDSLSGSINSAFSIKEGKSQPPKRYTSGSLILAMENAGQLIEEQELREEIKGSGIGTSATRADVISKLQKIKYIQINPKTQTVTPDKLGELVYEVLKSVIPMILIPKYTASWETGLSQVKDGKITKDFYLQKIYGYINACIAEIKKSNITDDLKHSLENLKKVYSDINENAQSQQFQSGSNASKSTGLFCPVCGSPIVENSKAFSCSGYTKGCKFVVWKKQYGKNLPAPIISFLIKSSEKKDDGTVESKVTTKIDGFISKAQTEYSAKLQIKADASGNTKTNLIFDNN